MSVKVGDVLLVPASGSIGIIVRVVYSFDLVLVNWQNEKKSCMQTYLYVNKVCTNLGQATDLEKLIYNIKD